MRKIYYDCANYQLRFFFLSIRIKHFQLALICVK